MRRIGWLAIALLAIAALAWLADSQMMAKAEGEVAAEKAVEKKAAEHGYLGAAACKMCHKSEAKGAQYPKWEASRHAHAYKSLLTDESQEICKKLGIKEAPEKADKCLKCHVTGHGVKPELLGKKYTVEEGVGCESCHGPAADWKKIHIKDPAEAMTLGLMKPDDEKMCQTCHNEESPTYKPFKMAEKLPIIAHPKPAQVGE